MSRPGNLYILLALVWGAALCSPNATAQSELPSSFEDFMRGRRTTRPATGGTQPPATDGRIDDAPVREPRVRDQRQFRQQQPLPDSGIRIQPASSSRRTSRESANGGSEFVTTKRLPAAYIESFDWSHHSTSIVDLVFATSGDFQHGNDFLAVPDEHEAYLDLVDTIARQRRQLRNTPRTTLAQQKSLWEESFYRFEHARELAFNRGKLKPTKSAKKMNGLANPFGPVISQPGDSTEDLSYDVLRDANNFPEHFVGRPIVLMGIFNPSGYEEITDKEILPPDVSVATEGSDEGTYREIKVLRGSLVDLKTKARIAIVDAAGILGPDGVPLSTRNHSRKPQLVMVKGWVVKDWKGVPLIYTDQLRELRDSPPARLFADHTESEQRVRETERWLYYETLRHQEIVPNKSQRIAAGKFLKDRIDKLMLEIARKARSDIAALQKQVDQGVLSQDKFDRQVLTLKRRVKLRTRRYREYVDDPAEFPTYVDMFNHSDEWQGQPVTLRGHIRHSVSYTGDELLFDGRKLYELWLFTDDSQHNPAVIVTPNLPADFPLNAEVVDGVSVTGTLFKRYVYDAQNSTRVAPLILAGQINWTPSAAQVASLIEEGHIDRTSAIAKAAAAQPKDRTSSTLLTILAIFFVLLLMVLWGRAQREERDRVRLRKRVSEDPEFESALGSGYGPEAAFAGVGQSTSLVDELLSDQGPNATHRPPRNY